VIPGEEAVASDSLLRSDETADGALAGAIRVIQPRKGYRFAIDSVLLARFAAERPVAKALDLGAGCGVVTFCLFALGGAQEVVGIEIQPEMVDRAKRGAALNQAAGRAHFLEGDVRGVEGLVPRRTFDMVVANPPYRPTHGGRISPDPSVAVSRHEVAGDLPAVVSAAAYAVASKGEFCTVYPAGRLVSLLAHTRAVGLEPKVLRLIHPRQGEPASLALLRCAEGAREGLEVRSPLYLHAPDARYSAEAEALLGAPGTA